VVLSGGRLAGVFCVSMGVAEYIAASFDMRSDWRRVLGGDSVLADVASISFGVYCIGPRLMSQLRFFFLKSLARYRKVFRTTLLILSVFRVSRHN
jgi:hypothetical protein